MICDYYGGPNDGGTMVIDDERCGIGTVHEWVVAIPGDAGERLLDFADPTIVERRVQVSFYHLTGVTSCRGITVARLEYMRP